MLKSHCAQQEFLCDVLRHPSSPGRGSAGGSGPGATADDVGLAGPQGVEIEGKWKGKFGGKKNPIAFAQETGKTGKTIQSLDEDIGIAESASG